MHLSRVLRDINEPGNALAEAADLRALADQVEALAVHRARAQDWDWEQIASALGIPRKQMRARHSHHARYP